MVKTVVLQWEPFFGGRAVPLERNRVVHQAARYATAAHLALMPKAVFAAAVSGATTWTKLFITVMGIADWLCVGVIIFAGTIWMFGNRTKALDLILCGSSGYIIIRHAVDIRNWLRTL